MSLTPPLVLLFCDIILLYVVTERIRSRLRRFHPDLFHALGKPAPEDSNFQYNYWMFFRFIWWDHRQANDPELGRLCMLYCLGAIAAMVLIVILTVGSSDHGAAPSLRHRGGR